MPELPEVETVKNTLKELILNKRIESVDIYYERIIQNVSTDYFKESLKGERFVDIDRYGKYLIIILEKHIIVSHLRMEGKYFLKGKEEKAKHEHVIFNLENGETLRYDDTRKFGVMYLFDTTDVSEVRKLDPLNKLGLEPFDKELDAAYLINKTKKMKGPIKRVLLDQSVICGLGNIYVDEVLFMARLHPEEDIKKLTIDDFNNIIKASIEVLNKAIKLGGTTIRSFVSSNHASGLFQNELLVHTKETCPKCLGKIEKIRVGGRGTYYCPNCQKFKS